MPAHVYPESDRSAFHIYESENCYSVDPFMHFEKTFSNMYYYLKPSVHQEASKHGDRIGQVIRMKELSKIEARKHLSKLLELPLQAEVIQLLQETKKKAQQKLIKAIEFRSPMFVAIPLYAWNKFKMPYTQIITDFLPKELNEKVFPDFLYQNEDNFTFSGQTDMSAGEMKSAMTKRNRVISDIMGTEDYWHCFFRTMAGIRGKEEPHLNQPHLHYISSAWGIKKEAVIKQLSSYRYNLNAETIPFLPDK